MTEEDINRKLQLVNDTLTDIAQVEDINLLEKAVETVKAQYCNTTLGSWIKRTLEAILWSRRDENYEKMKCTYPCHDIVIDGNKYDFKMSLDIRQLKIKPIPVLGFGPESLRQFNEFLRTPGIIKATSYNFPDDLMCFEKGTGLLKRNCRHDVEFTISYGGATNAKVKLMACRFEQTGEFDYTLTYDFITIKTDNDD